MDQPPTAPFPTDIIDLTWDTDDEDDGLTATAATAAALAATVAAAAAAAVTAVADMAQFTVGMMEAFEDLEGLRSRLQGSGGKRPDLVAAYGEAYERRNSARGVSGCGGKRRPISMGKPPYWARKRPPCAAVEEAAEPVQPPAKRRRVRVRIKTLDQQFDRWQGVKGKVYPGKRETPAGGKLDCFLCVLPTGELVMSNDFAMTSATVLDCEGVVIRPHANGNLYVPTHNAGKVYFCKK